MLSKGKIVSFLLVASLGGGGGEVDTFKNS